MVLSMSSQSFRRLCKRLLGAAVLSGFLVTSSLAVFRIPVGMKQLFHGGYLFSNGVGEALGADAKLKIGCVDPATGDSLDIVFFSVSAEYAVSGQYSLRLHGAGASTINPMQPDSIVITAGLDKSPDMQVFLPRSTKMIRVLNYGVGSSNVFWWAIAQKP